MDNRRIVEIHRELAECFELAKKLRSACDTYLQDPDDPSRYTLDPRAEEVFVVYEEPTGEVTKTGREITRRKRASLQHLLNLVQDALHVAACNVETRHADPRELILKALNTLEKQLRMLGDLTGAFKKPADNLEDVAWQERQAHERMVNLYRVQQKRDEGRIISYEQAEEELQELEANTEADLAELERLWLSGE